MSKLVESIRDVIQHIEDTELEKAEYTALLIEAFCIFDAMPRAVWDFEGTFVYVNESFAEILGYKPQELIGTPFQLLMTPETVADSMRVYRENMDKARHMMEDYDNSYYHKDGSVVHLRWKKGWNIKRLQLGSGQVEVRGTSE